jgi:hypothetical protein
VLHERHLGHRHAEAKTYAYPYTEHTQGWWWETPQLTLPQHHNPNKHRAARQKLGAKTFASLDPGLGGDAPAVDRIDQRRVVALALVRVGLGEVGECAIEDVALAEIGGDR